MPLTFNVQLTTATEAANILVMGDQGSGKSAVIRGWTEQILARGERAIIHDAKGDVLATAPTSDILLVAPHDAREWTWNIGCDVTNEQGAREVVEKLVPSASQLESMWSDGAKAILSGAIEALQRERVTAWGWADLFAFVFQSPQQLRAALDAARSPTAHLIELDSDGTPVKTTLSLMLTLWVAALTTIRPLAQSEAAHADRRFSVRDWLSERSTLPRTIILQHNAEYPLLSTAISSLLVDIVCGRLLSPSAPKRAVHGCTSFATNFQSSGASNSFRSCSMSAAKRGCRNRGNAELRTDLKALPTARRSNAGSALQGQDRAKTQGHPLFRGLQNSPCHRWAGTVATTSGHGP